MFGILKKKVKEKIIETAKEEVVNTVEDNLPLVLGIIGMGLLFFATRTVTPKVYKHVVKTTYTITQEVISNEV